MRRAFLASLLGLMSLHLGAVVFLGSLREQGPRFDLHLTSTSRALVLFGKNSMHMNVYKLFDSWSQLEAHLAHESLHLPPISEVSQMPPTSLTVEAIAPNENQGASEEYKILWSRNGHDRYALHTPDSQSANVLRNYVYYNGFESSRLGLSLPISAATP
ncbi:MAG: hypothetical protein ABIR96_04080 [Bdellovibrionota bacterium]